MFVLEQRIRVAKRFLNEELTHIKTNDGKAHLPINEVGYHLDAIHEAERMGLRHLDERHFARIRRTLTSVEALMNLNKN
ncbi:MAG: hypothetical protein RMM53_05625 [Bacteroidia bacterium]|nr:hypothetical protein [Bacteroidia bacterium]MDW8333674.1 hypothetical protein [Bacteroidia bacterium]